jgi:hypothetical protein
MPFHAGVASVGRGAGLAAEVAPPKLTPENPRTRIPNTQKLRIIDLLTQPAEILTHH